MNSKKILVIDDEAPMRYLLERQLCRAGFSVQTAGDGLTGLALAAERRPDAIVLDIMMPDMDGFDVCDRLKSNEATADIPVIFLSASVDSERRQRAFAMGAADVLSKPVQSDELAGSIQAVLRHNGQRASRPGRVIGFFGLTGSGMAAPAALTLAQAVPMKSDSKALLVDLELPFGAIAARLGLAPRPDALDVLGWRGHLTSAAILDAAQPYRHGLHVLPSPVLRDELDEIGLASRLGHALDTLVGENYTVILNLGPSLSEIALAAMRRADLVCAVTADDGEASLARYTQFLREVDAQGLAAERFIPVVGDGDHGRIPGASPRPAVSTHTAYLRALREQPRPSNLRQLAAALI